MTTEPTLPPNWGRLSTDDLSDEEFAALNPLGQPKPGAKTHFGQFTAEDFAEMESELEPVE